MSVSEGLPFGEASKSNKTATKKRRVTKKRRKIYPTWVQDRSTRVTKKPSSKSYQVVKKLWLLQYMAV